MKNRILLLSLIIIGISSCCKKELVVGIEFSYPGLNTNAYVLRLSKDAPYTVIDTSLFVSLTDNNNHSFYINLHDSNTYNYVIETDSLMHSDTISDVNFEIKGSNCNARINDFEYQLNGVKRTENKIEIN